MLILLKSLNGSFWIYALYSQMMISFIFIRNGGNWKSMQLLSKGEGKSKSESKENGKVNRNKGKGDQREEIVLKFACDHCNSLKYAYIYQLFLLNFKL